MLISEQYRDLNKKLHESNAAYGISGSKWADEVKALAAQLNSNDVLDYGCGKCTLAKSLPELNIHNYDPAIPEHALIPVPHDIVVCTDVLEHIEPECLDAVLDDLQRLTKRAGFFVVATRPAKKVLDDGRNAHLIQKSYRWWLPKFMERFELINFGHMGGEFLVVVAPK